MTQRENIVRLQLQPTLWKMASYLNGNLVAATSFSSADTAEQKLVALRHNTVYERLLSLLSYRNIIAFSLILWTVLSLSITGFQEHNGCTTWPDDVEHSRIVCYVLHCAFTNQQVKSCTERLHKSFHTREIYTPIEKHKSSCQTLSVISTAHCRAALNTHRFITHHAFNLNWERRSAHCVESYSMSVAMMHKYDSIMRWESERADLSKLAPTHSCSDDAKDWMSTNVCNLILSWQRSWGLVLNTFSKPIQPFLGHLTPNINPAYVLSLTEAWSNSHAEYLQN